ncbi:MAG: hypothetical protein ACKOU7_12540 [Ferruginibacter sp.]
MKKVIITMAVLTSMLVYLLSSCYKNKEDILALPTTSFRADVVPILVSGGCGCHNNGVATRVLPFSHADTIFYDAILARAFVLDTMARFDKHPGGGVIFFTDNQKNIITSWVKQGAKDDGGGCTVTGTVTYTAKILPLYTTTCKGSTCHGGLAINLDYSKMVAKKDVLSAMMASGGASGHPGPVLSLSSCTVKLIQEWIAQGQPQ